MKTKSKTEKKQPTRVTPRARTKRSAAAPSPAPGHNEFRPKRILVTTDFSDESKTALPCAAAFAQRFGGEIALLNVVESQSHFAGLESVILLQSGDAAMGRVYKGLDKLAGQAFPSKTPVTTHARTGKPLHEITNAARELEADLIIMATHGYSGLKHALIGSTTERVVQLAPCPVLAVRDTADGTSGKRPESAAIERILLTTDFSENSLKAFPLAQSLAEGFGARLTLMHVVERFPIDALLGKEVTRETSTQLVEQAQTRLTELAAGLRQRDGFEAGLVVRFGKPSDEITRFAQELDASLLVVATHGYTGLKHLFLGSVAERVLRHAHCPVLIVRETTR